MQTGLYNIVSEKEYIKYHGLWHTAYLADTELTRTMVPVKREMFTMFNDPTPSISPQGLDRAHSLMSQDAFKTFVTQDDAALLLVDGHCRNYSTRKTSPLSVRCASFAAALEQSPSLVVLHYFGGLHTNSRRALSGPLGLVKNLIGQLLAYEDPGSSMEQKYVRGAKKDDIECVCEILRELLLRLGKSKVIIRIIDNVCEFEKKYCENWLQHLTVIFETLYDLVDRRRTGGHIKLKVLLTGADRSTQLVDKVTSQEHISLLGKNMAPGHMIARSFPSPSS